MEKDGGRMRLGYISFLSRIKETLMVNLTPRQINLTPQQMKQICRVAPSPLTVHTIPKIL